MMAGKAARTLSKTGTMRYRPQLHNLAAVCLLFILSLWAVKAAGQVSLYDKQFTNITVPYNAPDGLVLPFSDAPAGIITQFWWGFTSSGWRDLHIRFTAPGGTVLEQVAGQAWMDISPIFGREAGGNWDLRLTETLPGDAHTVSVGMTLTVLRHANPNLPVTGTNVPQLNSVDNLILDWLKNNEFEAATLAVMRNRRLVYKKGYGWQDYNRTTPISPDAVMRLASNTKMITARAIQKLMEDGKLSPNDKVYNVLGIAPWGGGAVTDPRVLTITIQQLLDHRAGFPHDAPSEGSLGQTMGLNRAATLTESIACIWKQSLLFDPGTNYQYSNLGYQILGAVVEKLSGLSYDQFVKTQIDDPLGIRTLRVAHSTAAEKAPNEIWYAGHAYGNRSDDTNNSQGLFPEPYCTNMETRPGAGSLICSAQDYCRFLRSYFHTGMPKPVSLQGWSWSYTFYGSWPGTWTATRDMINPDGTSITYVLLVNERNDADGDALSRLTGQLDGYFQAVAQWPANDLFVANTTGVKNDAWMLYP